MPATTHIQICVASFVNGVEDFTIQYPLSAKLGEIRNAIQEKIGGKRNLDRVWTTMGTPNTLFLFDATHREHDNLPVLEHITNNTMDVGVFRYSVPIERSNMVLDAMTSIWTMVRSVAHAAFPYAMAWAVLV